MGKMNVNIQRMPADYQNLSNVQKKDAKEPEEDFKKLLKDKPEQEVQKDSTPEKKDAESINAPEKQEVDETLAAVQVGQMLRGSYIIELPQEAVPEVAAEVNVDMAVGEAAVDTAQQMPETAVMPVIEDKAEDAGIQDGMQEVQQKVEAPVQQTENAVVNTDEVQSSKAPEKKQEMKTEKAEVSKEEHAVFSEGNPALEQVTKANAEVHHVSRAEAKQPVHTEHMQVENPEEISQKLPQEIMAQVTKGVNEFEIQVEPEHLGKIAIKVLYEHGQTTVMIACSEKQTQNLIGQRAGELGQVMERNLGEETTVYVEKQQPDYLNQNQRENDQAGRESEQERQKEEQRKHQTNDTTQFLQKLRLGLSE